MTKLTPQKVFSVIILVMGSFICLIPFYWLVRSSLMTSYEIFEFPPKLFPSEAQWRNYIEVFEIIDFGLYLKNTMTIMIPVIFGTIMTSCMSGYAFARLEFKGRDTIFNILVATMMLPSAVTMIPTFMIWSKLGAVDTYYPLIVPAFLGGGGFNIFLMRQFFMNIPKELDEAAILDGASHYRIFFSVLLPLIKPAMMVIGFFTFIGVWNDFFGPLIYLNDNSKYTLALGLLQLKGTYSSNWNLMMAASTIMVIPAIMIFFLGQKYFIQGISLTSGTKG